MTTEETTETREGDENQRAQIKRLERQLKEKDAELAAKDQEIGQSQQILKEQTFREAGYPIEDTGPGALMAKTWPEGRELTAEAVRGFAEEHGLVTQPAAAGRSAEETQLAALQSSSESVTDLTTEQELDEQIKAAQDSGDMKSLIALQLQRIGKG